MNEIRNQPMASPTRLKRLWLPAGFPRAMALVLLMALLVRLLYCFILGPALVEKSGQDLGWMMNGKIAVDPYDQIARNLVLGRGYVDDTQRRNYERLPIYVYFLAGLYSVWGFDLWKVQIVQSVIDTLSCLLVFLIARRILQAPTAALVAAVLYASYFKMINMASRPMSETLYVFLLLLFLHFFVLSFSRTKFSLSAGLGLGLLTLTRPITLFFPVVAVALYFHRLKTDAFRHAIPFLLGFSMLIVPLLVHNYLDTGKVFFSLGGGKILYMGAVIDYSKKLRGEEQRLVREIQETNPLFPYDAAVDASMRSLAVQRIKAAPGAYARRVAYRLYLFWTYPDYSTPLMAVRTSIGLIFSTVVIALAVYGVLLARAKGAPLSPLLWVFLYSYGLYALIYASPRFSLPLFPILFIFAALGIVTLWRERLWTKPT